MENAMDFSSWEQLARGHNCPFDTPRPPSTTHWEYVTRLEVSTLYLAKNQTYRGQCLIILDLRHATRPDQLTSAEWAAYCSDLHRAEVAVHRTVQPDHINIAALGNVIPHLHWHIIPRYRTDPRWGNPIWPEEAQHRLSAADEQALVAALRGTLTTR
jgi:diadenosine tetraphosphate (Ap4A) HIT family hydrolase